MNSTRRVRQTGLILARGKWDGDQGEVAVPPQADGEHE